MRRSPEVRSVQWDASVALRKSGQSDVLLERARARGMRCGMSSAQHPLLDLYLSCAKGRFPAADGTLRVLPALDAGLEASIAFTGHAVVCTALEPRAVHARGIDAFGGSLAPPFLCWSQATPAASARST
jgi:hypothetical protein